MFLINNVLRNLVCVFVSCDTVLQLFMLVALNIFKSAKYVIIPQMCVIEYVTVCLDIVFSRTKVRVSGR